jgi:hypothetical protein
VVICGSHESFTVLPGAEHFARWLGLTSLGIKALPMTIGGWAIVATLLASIVVPLAWPLVLPTIVIAFIPRPTAISIEVLPPMRPLPSESDAQTAERVRNTMQAAMDRLSAERRRGPHRDSVRGAQQVPRPQLLAQALRALGLRVGDGIAR